MKLGKIICELEGDFMDKDEDVEKKKRKREKVKNNTANEKIIDVIARMERGLRVRCDKIKINKHISNSLCFLIY
jgi:hypothetical protein